MSRPPPSPPLNALRAFEAFARHGGMTAAAAELCVTHGAVSRQVRVLQEALGAPLVLLLAFDYSTKAIAAGSLNVGFGAGLSQTLSMYESSVIWGMAYELSIMAKVVF